MAATPRNNSFTSQVSYQQSAAWASLDSPPLSKAGSRGGSVAGGLAGRVHLCGRIVCVCPCLSREQRIQAW